MTRERINELWPVMEHFRNGGEVECRQKHYAAVHWTSTECPCFSDTDLVFRIKPSPRLVPLEADDWLHGGPWWVRHISGPHGGAPAIPVGPVEEGGCVRIMDHEGFRIVPAGEMMVRYQRRSGSDPEGRWQQCSKPAKE